MTASLSLNEIRSRAGAFAHRWAGTTRENANTQVFWAEFFHVFGMDHKRVVIFEKNTDRFSTQNRGRIDVFWPGELLIEQKSFGKNLDVATAQAFDYLGSLSDKELPKLVITSDFNTFQIHDLTVSPVSTTTFELSEFPDYIDMFVWIAGYTKRQKVHVQEETANAVAVKKMGALYEALTSEDQFSDHHTSVLLTRLLFLMFAEDTGLIERGLFSQLVRDRGGEDGSYLGGVLGQLFQVLNTPEGKRSSKTDELMLQFPYVNGGLFSETIPLAMFDDNMKTALIAATDFEWGLISPAIFGSMFQAVKSKELRRDLGEHYTTERDILKTLGPLFLDELRTDFESSKHSVQKLKNLRKRLGTLRFLDPACGCGNFLIITYRELRALELSIMERLQQLTGDNQLALDASLGLEVNLAQFNGIEIEEWPARIAETALFMVDHQANRAMIEKFGQAPDRLPIEVHANIVTANALRLDWSEVLTPTPTTIVVGNPPFSGAGFLSAEQSQELRDVWGAAYYGYLDYVTGWYIKAVDYFGDVPGTWAYVSTSSICQGEPVPALFAPILAAGWSIDFAHRGLTWHSEASGKAGVHVSIVGFTTQSKRRRLFTYSENGRGDAVEEIVPNISPYLSAGPNVLVRPRTKPLSPSLTPIVKGNQPTDGGNLIVTPAEFDSVAADPVASKYLRKFIGAKEIINGNDRWCLWLTEVDPKDVDRSPMLKKRIEAVREMRLGSTKKATQAKAATPHLFDEIRHPSTSYLAIPSVASMSRPYFLSLHVGPEVITSNLAFIAPDPDGFLFGLVSSSFFITWQRAIGGRLRADLRFSNTLVWNNFPVPPAVNEVQRQAVIDAGKDVLDARKQQDNLPLSAMYNPLAMRPELVKAHQKLDAAVYKLFGLRKAPQTDADRLAVLLKKYAELGS